MRRARSDGDDDEAAVAGGDGGKQRARAAEPLAGGRESPCAAAWLDLPGELWAMALSGLPSWYLPVVGLTCRTFRGVSAALPLERLTCAKAAGEGWLEVLKWARETAAHGMRAPVTAQLQGATWRC